MNSPEFTEIQDLLKLFTLSSWAVGFGPAGGSGYNKWTVKFHAHKSFLDHLELEHIAQELLQKYCKIGKLLFFVEQFTYLSQIY